MKLPKRRHKFTRAIILFSKHFCFGQIHRFLFLLRFALPLTAILLKKFVCWQSIRGLDKLVLALASSLPRELVLVEFCWQLPIWTMRYHGIASAVGAAAASTALTTASTVCDAGSATITQGRLALLVALYLIDYGSLQRGVQPLKAQRIVCYCLLPTCVWEASRSIVWTQSNQIGYGTIY